MCIPRLGMCFSLRRRRATPAAHYIATPLHAYIATRRRPAEQKERPSKALSSQAHCYYSKSQAADSKRRQAQTTRLSPDSLFESTRIAIGLACGTARSPVADGLRKTAACHRCCRCGNTPEISMPSRTLQKAIDSFGGHEATPTPRPLEGRKHAQNRNPDRRALPRGL